MKTVTRLAVLIGAALVVVTLAVVAAVVVLRPAQGAGGQTIRGSGNTVTESRAVSGITGVRLGGIGELDIVQGDKEALSITAEDNLMPLIHVTMEGTVLVLTVDPPQPGDTIEPGRPIRFDLSVKELALLQVDGSARATARALQAGRLEVTLNGAGIVELAGRAAGQNVHLAGGGQYLAADLESGTAQITVEGTGSATLWAHDQLQVHCTGACAVKYYGSPAVTRDVSGVGSVTGLGDK